MASAYLASVGTQVRAAVLVEGDVGQVRGADRTGADLNRRVRLLAGLHAIEEVLHVRLDRNGRVHRLDRGAVRRPRLLPNLKAGLIDDHGAAVALKLDAPVIVVGV